MNHDQQDLSRDVRDLERLAKGGWAGAMSTMAGEELRLLEMLIHSGRGLATLQGLTPPESLTPAQYHYWKNGTGTSDSPWRGEPPPVPAPIPDQPQGYTVIGRRAEVRSPSPRDRQQEAAETQLQEDHNAEIPLSLADLEGLPY